MDTTVFKQACGRLFPRGFSPLEVFRLCRFRARYGKSYLDQAVLDSGTQHLEFIRWLVSTGRLSDS